MNELTNERTNERTKWKGGRLRGYENDRSTQFIVIAHVLKTSWPWEDWKFFCRLPHRRPRLRVASLSHFRPSPLSIRMWAIRDFKNTFLNTDTRLIHQNLIHQINAILKTDTRPIHQIHAFLKTDTHIIPQGNRHINLVQKSGRQRRYHRNTCVWDPRRL